MTDPGQLAGGAPLPPTTFFDPAFERIPASAAWDGSYAGPVLLLFDPRADRYWVADAAIALATAWTQAGRRVVLADLSLDDPLLHERIGMANLDGVVDIFMYGASLARSARPVPGRGFYLISGGTYTDDAGSILRHPRWEKIVAGFREAQASLLLFAPADAQGVEGLARWAGDAILFGAPGAGHLFGGALPADVRAHAWLAPPLAEPSPHAEPHRDHAGGFEDRFPEPEPAPAPWPSTPPEMPTPTVAAPADPTNQRFPTFEELVGAPAAEVPVPDPSWETATMPSRFGGRRRRKKGGDEAAGEASAGAGPAAKKSASSRLIILLLLLLLAVAALFLYGDQLGLPDLMGMGGGKSAAPAATAAAPPPPAPKPAAPAAAAERGVPLPYAVSTVNFDAAAAARNEVRKKSAKFPDVPFYVVPETNQGRLYYKVLAGLFADTAQAVGVRDRLVAAGEADTGNVVGPWQLIQPRPWAFDLGTFATDSAATVHADSLAARGIPGYVVPVPFTDGERFRVYGGAFADSLAAQPMQGVLKAARIDAPLVRRTGRAPAAPAK